MKNSVETRNPATFFIYSRKLENTLGALISLSTMPIHQFSLQKSESCTVHAKIDLLPYIKKNLENILTKVINHNTNPNYLASKSLPKERQSKICCIDFTIPSHIVVTSKFAYILNTFSIQ